jgi:vacuolar-type H+-ATPase subunit I/STV1
MDNANLEKLIWLLIYAGMLVFGLGAWYVEHSLGVGSTLMTIGACAVAAGVLLVWVRSRRP